MNTQFVDFGDEECDAIYNFLLEWVKLHPLKNCYWTLIPTLDCHLKDDFRCFQVGALSTAGKRHIGVSVSLKALMNPKKRKIEMDCLWMSVEDCLKEVED